MEVAKPTGAQGCTETNTMQHVPSQRRGRGKGNASEERRTSYEECETLRHHERRAEEVAAISSMTSVGPERSQVWSVWRGLLAASSYMMRSKVSAAPAPEDARACVATAAA